MGSDLDLLLINPNGRDRIYQELGEELTAVEPPLWCRLIAGYVRDRGYSVEIIDAEAEGFGPETVADKVAARRPAADRHDRVRPSALRVHPADGGGEPHLPRHQAPKC